MLSNANSSKIATGIEYYANFIKRIRNKLEFILFSYKGEIQDRDLYKILCAIETKTVLSALNLALSISKISNLNWEKFQSLFKKLRCLERIVIQVPNLVIQRQPLKEILHSLENHQRLETLTFHTQNYDVAKDVFTDKVFIDSPLLFYKNDGFLPAMTNNNPFVSQKEKETSSLFYLEKNEYERDEDLI